MAASTYTIIYALSWTVPSYTAETQSSTVTFTTPSPATTLWTVSATATNTLASPPTVFYLISISFPPLPAGFTSTTLYPPAYLSSATGTTTTTTLSPSSSEPTNSATLTTITSTNIDGASTTSTLPFNGALTSTPNNVTTTTQSFIPADATSKPKSGVTISEVAGIGIGSAIIGALLVAALSFCLMRRRHKPTLSSKATPESAAPPSDRSIQRVEDGKGVPSVDPYALEPSGASFPPPEEDQAIASNISRLATLIKNHAQSYFTSTDLPALAVDSFLAEVQELLGDASPVLPETVLTLLGTAKFKVSAVRFLLAWSILRNIDGNAPLTQTLLPPEIAQNFQSIKATKANASDQDLLLSRWRHVTGMLMKSSYGLKLVSATDPRRLNINKLVVTLNSVLGPFATSSRGRSKIDQDRERNMEEIIRLGARDGYLLFVQPTVWKFEWQRLEGELVVFPALLKIGDEQGRSYNQDLRQVYVNSQTIDISSISK